MVASKSIPILLSCTFFCLLFMTRAAFGQYYQKAEYCCGKQELQYLNIMEMQYPEKAFQNHIEGKVKLTFALNPDGSKSDINIHQSVGPEIDKEAIRLLKLQVWKSAIRNGEKVRSKEEASFKFHIKKYNKAVRERGYDIIDYPLAPVDTGFRIYTLTELEKFPEPVFKYKNQNLANFINQEMEYPEMAYKMNISGTVKVGFVIEKSGNVSHVCIQESVGGGCDQEAIRILKKISWMPGVKNGKAVRARTTMKITFKLNGSDHKYMPNNQNNSY